MAVVWTEPALAEVSRVYLYLRDFNPDAARKESDHIRQVGNGLVNFPQRGRPVLGTALREVVTRYPYVIRYPIVGEDVIILRVRHTARRPTDA